MRKLRTTLLAVALVSSLVPSITVPAQAAYFGWQGGWGWGPGLATGAIIGGAVAGSYPGAVVYYPGYGPAHYDPRVYATYCTDLLWCTSPSYGAYGYRLWYRPRVVVRHRYWRHR